jgi:hypothetical protein
LALIRSPPLSQSPDQLRIEVDRPGQVDDRIVVTADSLMDLIPAAECPCVIRLELDGSSEVRKSIVIAAQQPVGISAAGGSLRC